VWTLGSGLEPCIQEHDARPDPGSKHHNPVIIAMAQRLEQRGLTPKAIVGASMRKLVHLIYGVLKLGQPFKAEIPMAGLEVQEGI